MRSRKRRDARKLSSGAVCRFTGKATYTDRRRANSAAKLHGMLNSTAQFPYVCGECGAWHLTTSKQHKE